MSMLRSRVGVAVMQNRLFAIGGYNGQERLNTVEVNNRSFFSLGCWIPVLLLSYLLVLGTGTRIF
jgi:hypothetical protein